MAISQAMTTSFKVEILNGLHAFGTSVVRAGTGADSFRIGLYTASTASLSAATTVYSNTGEITGTGYTNTGVQSTTGQALAISQVPISSSTTAYINFTNPQWTGASFSADGALLWNSTQAGKAVAVLDFAGTKTVSSGTFTIQMPTAAPGTAILQIA